MSRNEIGDLLGTQFADIFQPPRRRGKSQASQEIIQASVRILDEIAPASVRAVCYRLFTESLIPNMSKASTDKVSRLLVWAREQEIIPWAHIVDETRAVEQTPSWSDPQSLIRTAVDQYRKDYWETQPYRVEVWSEKGTVRGTLAPVLSKYGVAFRVMHGYGSATAVHGIADASVASDKPFIALYVGDWDPSGLHMSESDLPSRIRDYGGNVTIWRIALCVADTQAGLPSFEAETKRGDPRHRWFVDHFGSTCWELDALSPVLLRQRVEKSIVRFLDMDTWKQALHVESVERESMSDVLGQWSKLMQASKYS